MQFPRNLDEWSIDQVVTWMGTLKLANDYSQKIKKDCIDGSTLHLIFVQKEWEDFGFAKGDVLKIKAGMENLKS